MRLTRSALAIAALTLIALPAAAQRRGPYDETSSLRIRIGEFSPRGSNDYWIDKRNDFTGSESSFDDTLAGVDYIHAVGPRLSLIVSGNSWEAQAAQEYLNFVDDAGLSIFHTTSFEVTSIHVGLLFHLAPRRATVRPYVGGGGGYYDWTLVEDGDFIDFADLSIFTDRFQQSNDSFGWFWVAGLEVPVGEAWRVFAEGRWDRVDDELAGDFAGLGTLDLSGTTFAFGAGWSF